LSSVLTIKILMLEYENQVNRRMRIHETRPGIA
jgi:hypothetical protein